MSTVDTILNIRSTNTHLPNPLQDLINLILVITKVINQIIPHLGVVLVDILALHRPISDGEHPGRLEHERDRALGDAHLRRRRGARGLEFLVRHAVWHHAALETHAAWLELVGASAVGAVDQAHELGRGVPVVVWWAVGVRGDVPAGREDEKVGEGRGWVAGFGGQDAED